MIIDCDTHIAPATDTRQNITAEVLIETMNKTGVDKAFSWALYPYNREKLEDYNCYTYESMKAYPDRIAGFAWIDPGMGIERAVKETKVCMEEYGLYGAKLNGSQNVFRYDNLDLLGPIVEVIAKAKGIVAMHVGADCPERTHPYFAKRLADAFPNTQFLMIHMGGVSYPDLSDCAAEVAQSTPNMHLIGSHVGAISVLRVVNQIGASRVSFASDTPFNLMRAEKASYLAMLCEHTQEEIDLVMGENAVNILAKTGR